MGLLCCGNLLLSVSTTRTEEERTHDGPSALPYSQEVLACGLPSRKCVHAEHLIRARQLGGPKSSDKISDATCMLQRPLALLCAAAPTEKQKYRNIIMISL